MESGSQEDGRAGKRAFMDVNASPGRRGTAAVTELADEGRGSLDGGSCGGKRTRFGGEPAHPAGGFKTYGFGMPGQGATGGGGGGGHGAAGGAAAAMAAFVISSPGGSRGLGATAAGGAGGAGGAGAGAGAGAGGAMGPPRWHGTAAKSQAELRAPPEYPHPWPGASPVGGAGAGGHGQESLKRMRAHVDADEGALSEAQLSRLSQNELRLRGMVRTLEARARTSADEMQAGDGAGAVQQQALLLNLRGQVADLAETVKHERQADAREVRRQISSFNL